MTEAKKTFTGFQNIFQPFPKRRTELEAVRVERLRVSILADVKELHRILQQDSKLVEMLSGFRKGNHEVPCELVALANIMMLYSKEM